MSRRLSSLSRSVEGLVVHITGGASGMGRATARLFAEQGAKVAVSDVDAQGAQAVANEITEADRIARSFGLDVSDPSAITEVTAALVAEFGGLGCAREQCGDQPCTTGSKTMATRRPGRAGSGFCLPRTCG